MSERTTFLDDIRSGWTEPGELALYIDDWLRSRPPWTLREHLGFTEEQAARWVEDASYIDVILAEAGGVKP
jgi:hypothetical protein